MGKHTIAHVEIPANDLKAAGQFYHDVFGWKINHLPEMNYTTFDPDDTKSPGGGFMPVSDESPVGKILVHIHTDDINATLQQIVDCGGEVVLQRTEIPGIGWYAIFKDQTGNDLGLYEPLVKT